MIYFIQEENNGPIKIGCCYSLTPGLSSGVGGIIGRQLILQCGNPRKLYIIGHMKGTGKDEKQLHKKFKHLNILNEWFVPTTELISFINKNKILNVLERCIKCGQVYGTQNKNKKESYCFKCDPNRWYAKKHMKIKKGKTVNYLLKDIDNELWKKIKKVAIDENTTVKELIINEFKKLLEEKK